MQQSNVILPYLKTKAFVARTPIKLCESIKLSKPKIFLNSVASIKSKTIQTVHPLGAIRSTSGTAFKTIVRFSHTDLRVPDFTYYRRNTTKNPARKSMESRDSRNAFTYVFTGLASISALYSIKSVGTFFVMSMAASADVLAIAKIEVNLADIPEGKTAIFKWRGKPLFIKHRSQQEIAIERAVPVASLRDPQSDEERCTRPDFLVILGICTHLGCVPIPNSGDFPGGYYCPCHGSHYDGCGRIRKGPAPLNMEVPTHYYVNDDTLVVG